MKESIIFPVVIDENRDCEVEIIVDVSANTFKLKLNGVVKFSGDWKGNLFEVMKRAIKMWD